VLSWLAFHARKNRTTAARAAFCAGCCLWCAATAWPQQPSDDLTDRSLEDLMNVKVTSVSRTAQTLSRTAAAVFVIEQDDIQHSGATNMPDLLRMVPGMDVAEINANTWAVSIRGLNGEFSNELLVLVDGRTVYVPTFGGVYWDVLDMPLADIERIEVIRGPGGSVWGGNAVNGVVNIITKKASETKGGMVEASGGNLDQGSGTARYGGALGGRTDYRVYSKYFNLDHLPDLSGQNGHDDWHILRGGFRVDSTLSARDTLTVKGDMYAGQEGDVEGILPSVTSPSLVNTNLQVDLSGGFIQGIWNHSYSARSDSTLQISLDRYQRNDPLREGRSTLNADFQDHVQVGERQNVVWGAGYRFSASDSDGSLTVSLNPNDLDFQIFNLFAQDEIALLPDRLFLTLGTKVEHNDYTGFVVLPTARIAWNPTHHSMWWAAVSHAERTPASSDVAIRTNFGSFPGTGGIPVLIALVGNPHVKNEGLIAYEAGYRASPTSQFSIELAAYYNAYDHQETTEPSPTFSEPTPAPPHLVMPVTFANLIHGEAYGLEIAAKWKPLSRWTLSPGYAFEEIHMHTSTRSQDTSSGPEAEGSAPPHSAQLRSRLDLAHGFSWDASAYFVDRLKFSDVPSYTRVDTQLAWRRGERMSISVVGQNLARDHHIELIDPSGPVMPSLMKRSAYAKFTWRF
jgi:iron complex outermembrane recepter protein